MARSGLGKGLGALIGTPSTVARTEMAESGERVHQISLASVVPSTLQPRKDFGREALQELIDSIRQHGKTAHRMQGRVRAPKVPRLRDETEERFLWISHCLPAWVREVL